MTFVKNFWKEEDGQDLIEYSLLLAFLCLFAVTFFDPINKALGGIWGTAQTQTELANTTAAS